MAKYKWINVQDESPPNNVKVKLSYGLFGIRASVCDEWVSEGWLTKSGLWSITYVHNVHKNSKPTHWAYLK